MGDEAHMQANKDSEGEVADKEEVDIEADKKKAEDEVVEDQDGDGDGHRDRQEVDRRGGAHHGCSPAV